MLLYLIHVLLCLVVCLTFLPSHLSLKHVLYIRYVYIIQLQCMIIYLICTCITLIFSLFLCSGISRLSHVTKCRRSKIGWSCPLWMNGWEDSQREHCLYCTSRYTDHSLKRKPVFCHSLYIYLLGTLCRNLCKGQRGMMNGALIFLALTYIIIIILNGKNPGGGN